LQDVGIKSYVHPEVPGIGGKLKSKWEDFIVDEVTVDHEVVEITNNDIPILEKVEKKADSEKPTECVPSTLNLPDVPVCLQLVDVSAAKKSSLESGLPACLGSAFWSFLDRLSTKGITIPVSCLISRRYHRGVQGGIA